MPHTITTQKALRESFWGVHHLIECRRGPRGRILPQNQQPASTRAAFVDYVDHLARSGAISEALAQRATL